MDPTKYTPSYDFSDFEADNPTSPKPGAELDIEFANIATANGAAIDAIKDIRRSDGALKNGIVGPDQISAALSIGFTAQGEWTLDFDYSGGDGVIHDGIFYKALVAHTSTAENEPTGETTAFWERLFSLVAVNIEDASIGGAKLEAGAVGTRELADGGVTTAKLADASITPAKLNAGMEALFDLREWKGFKTVADLQSDNNVEVGYAASGAKRIVSPGDIITAQGFRCEVAASDATGVPTTTAGGVKARTPVEEIRYPERYGITEASLDNEDRFANAINDMAEGSILDLRGRTYLADQLFSYNFEKSGIRIRNGKLIVGTAGLRITGDGVRVSDLCVHRETKSTSGTISYSNAGLYLAGDDSVVTRVEAYNMEGPGIVMGGRRPTITHAYAHDNHMGLNLLNTVRDGVVAYSRLNYNDVVDSDGADGLLANRSVEGLLVFGCELSFNSEHGLYGQGQRFNIARNRVLGNAKVGLKFGSYDTNLFEYPGETLDRWVDGTGYGMSDIQIAGNFIADNQGSDGIYFQPSARRVDISDNTLINNRIRTVYFNGAGGDRLEDIYDISVRDNKVSGVCPDDSKEAGISISAYTGTKIEGNVCDGEIFTYGPNGDIEPRLHQATVNPIVENNKSLSVNMTRTVDGLAKDNVMDILSINGNSTDCVVVDNDIKNALPIDLRKILVFDKNRVNFISSDGTTLMESGLNEAVTVSFCDNVIDAPDATSATPKIRLDQGTPPSGRMFSGNRINMPNSPRGVVIGGARASVSSNVIMLASGADVALDCYTTNSSITGNVSNLGAITIRNDDYNLVVGNRVRNISNTGATNVVESNLLNP